MLQVKKLIQLLSLEEFEPMIDKLRRDGDIKDDSKEGENDVDNQENENDENNNENNNGEDQENVEDADA